MKSIRPVAPLALAFVLLAPALLAGCFGKSNADPNYVRPDTTASTETVGGGSLKAVVVGVYQDRVDRDGACAFSDWRVSFTTTYTRENGTYVYDTKDAKEYSVQNNSALLAKLNDTMRGQAPAYLAWMTKSDRGCQFEHREIVTNVTPLTNETPSS